MSTGFIIEVFDGNDVLTQGACFPDSLSKLHHEAGTCLWDCGYCYEEACAEYDRLQPLL